MAQLFTTKLRPFLYPRGNSYQGIEIKDIYKEMKHDINNDRILESTEIFSNGMNKFSQERDSLMSLMHSQVNNDDNRVIPEIQSIVSTLSLGQKTLSLVRQSKINTLVK